MNSNSTARELTLEPSWPFNKKNIKIDFSESIHIWVPWLSSVWFNAADEESDNDARVSWSVLLIAHDSKLYTLAHFLASNFVNCIFLFSLWVKMMGAVMMKGCYVSDLLYLCCFTSLKWNVFVWHSYFMIIWKTCTMSLISVGLSCCWH